jgi:hypothetical protein
MIETSYGIFYPDRMRGFDFRIPSCDLVHSRTTYAWSDMERDVLIWQSQSKEATEVSCELITVLEIMINRPGWSTVIHHVLIHA